MTYRTDNLEAGRIGGQAVDSDGPTPGPSTPASGAPPAETLDFLFAQIVEAPERQLEVQQMLDGKVVQVFTGSGVVLGLAAFLATSAVPDGALAFLIAAGALFLILGVTALAHLWPRRFYVTRHPAVLWRTYWSDSVSLVKLGMVDQAADVYDRNARTLGQKDEEPSTRFGARKPRNHLRGGSDHLDRRDLASSLNLASEASGPQAAEAWA